MASVTPHVQAQALLLGNHDSAIAGVSVKSHPKIGRVQDGKTNWSRTAALAQCLMKQQVQSGRSISDLAGSGLSHQLRGWLWRNATSFSFPSHPARTLERKCHGHTGRGRDLPLFLVSL